MEDNFKIQLIATQALHDKYGFCPAPQQVTLLESDGEGTYILFRVGEHEYRCENGEITNLEEQKKLDAELSANVELLRMRQRDMDELKSTIHYRELSLDKAAEKREELERKNRQLCNDLAGERWTVRILKRKLEESQKLADQWFEEARKYQAERDE